MEEIVELFAPNGGTEGLRDYSKLIAWAQEQVAVYDGLVVQEDAIQSAKSDTARLRRIAKNASDYRIALKKEHESKIAETIQQLQEITKIFNDAADAIDRQVKGFDDKRKAEKAEQIRSFFAETVGDMDGLITLEKIQSVCDGEKWMNKGFSIDEIKERIEKTIADSRDAIDSIKALRTKYESEMIHAYLQRLDIKDALKRRSELQNIDQQLIDQEREEKRRLAEEAEKRREEKETTTVVQKESDDDVSEQDEKKENLTEQEYRLMFEVIATKEKIYDLIRFLKENGYKAKKMTGKGE